MYKEKPALGRSISSQNKYCLVLSHKADKFACGGDRLTTAKFQRYKYIIAHVLIIVNNL